MNTIKIENDYWRIRKTDGEQIDLTGTVENRAQAALTALKNSDCGGVISQKVLIQDDQTLVSFDQWLTEKLNKPFVQGTKEDYQKLSQKIPWELHYYGYTPGKDEYSVESLLTVGNGFMGLRGTTPEMEIADENYPGLYLASLYNTAASDVAGHTIYNEDFVNAPNLQKIYLIIDDERIDIASNRLLSFERTLDLKTGLFQSHAVIETSRGKQIDIQTKKISSMAQVNYYSISYAFTPLNFSGVIQVISEADGTVYNYNVARYRSLTNQHLNILATDANQNKAILVAKTKQSGITISQTSELFSDTLDLNDLHNDVTTNKVIQTLTVPVKEETTYTLEKTVNVQKIRKEENSSSLEITPQQFPRFGTLYQDSTLEWEKLWEKAAIEVNGDLMSQKMLNLHTYHLLVSASPNANQSLDASITARGLHGEAYRGHIFWDELFILPFYTLHFPKTAREILLYRYRRLHAAKTDAKKAGYEGAMFPWQSGLDGTEQSQELHLNPISGEWKEDHSRLQRHVSLAIAYNVWQYWHITRDREFMEDYGLELILEIAKFWQSAATWDKNQNRYFIDRVMGPDEFHENYPNAEQGGLKNNAYTNMMVVWLFEEVEKLKHQMSETAFKNATAKTNVDEEILTSMADIRQKLTLEINQEGIIAQFEGYFDLKDLDWGHYKEKYKNIYRMDRILNAEGKSADAYKVAKQADSLMIFYNFSTAQVNDILTDLDYTLPEDYVEKNLHYYLQRTSHGSTLSRVVHAQLAAMVDDKNLAWKLYQEALSSDYHDIQGGTTAEGIHAGVMAATTFIPLTTFAGLDIREDILKFQPNLPTEWKDIAFNFSFRGIDFNINVTHETITLLASQATEVIVLGNTLCLEAQTQQTIYYKKGAFK